MPNDRGTDRPKSRIRIIELAATLFLAGIVVWHYRSRAPQAIIVLSFLLSLFILLFQLPFLGGYYGVRRFRPGLVVPLIVLPFLIAVGYHALYQQNLFLMWYWEWLGTMPPVAAAAVLIAMPFFSCLFGRLGRKLRRL